jgi:hypothetical protein
MLELADEILGTGGALVHALRSLESGAGDAALGSSPQNDLLWPGEAG